MEVVGELRHDRSICLPELFLSYVQREGIAKKMLGRMCIIEDDAGEITAEKNRATIEKGLVRGEAYRFAFGKEIVAEFAPSIGRDRETVADRLFFGL
jgi:hypothetical protein